MTPEADQLTVAVLAQPPGVRARLANELIASLETELESDVETEWLAVLDRRGREIASGAVTCNDAIQSVEIIRAKLNVARTQPS